MDNPVTDFVKDLWVRGRPSKTSADGWIVANAVCCTHNGESADKRKRGNVIANSNGAISYSCFNCSFKASYQPGRHLSLKFRKLVSWMGASENDVRRLVIEAIRVKEYIEEFEPGAALEKEEISFKSIPLPTRSIRYTDYIESAGTKLTDDFISCANYVGNRKIAFEDYDFYWTDETVHKMNRRIIIPYTWENKVIGYTGRAVDDDVKPKYYNQVDSHYVFNTDKQKRDWKFVIVCEGPFDAMSVDGVAIMHNVLSEQQIDIIDALGKEVIVVPDNDKSGFSIIEQAIDCGWSVSFPIWFETCKDINEAVCKYGKLFTLKAILEGKESSKLKIELLKKKVK